MIILICQSSPMNRLSIHIWFQLIKLAKLVKAGSLESICKAHVSLKIMRFIMDLKVNGHVSSAIASWYFNCGIQYCKAPVINAVDAVQDR